MYGSTMTTIPIFGTMPLDIMQGMPTAKRLNKMKNQYAYINQIDRLMNPYAHTRYRLKKGTCPDTINERELKRDLLLFGTACIFEKNDAVLALPCRVASAVSLYRDFGYGFVWSANGKLHEKIKLYIPGSEESKAISDTVEGQMGDKSTGVLIRETEDCYPFINHVIEYADTLSDIKRTMDTMRFQAKRPYIITAAESAVPTVRQAMKDTKDNEEFIIGTGIFNASDVNVFNLQLDTANNIKVMTENYDWVYNKFKELCGYDSNQQVDKKANLLQDEISMNKPAEKSHVQNVVDTLNKYTEYANKKFGLHMEWEIGHDEEEVEDVQQVQRDNDEDSDFVRRD